MNNRYKSLVLLSTIILFSCTATPDPNEGWESFGELITASGYSDLSQVIDDFGMDDEKSFKIAGTLYAVCQEKGCWTTLQTEDGRSVRMTFANYSFFLPIEAAGREIIAEGVGFKEETSVAELQHYLEDAKASPEEIAAVTQPKVEYKFEARGVLLR
jgi:hypothetical protein